MRSHNSVDKPWLHTQSQSFSHLERSHHPPPACFPKMVDGALFPRHFPSELGRYPKYAMREGHMHGDKDPLERAHSPIDFKHSAVRDLPPRPLSAEHRHHSGKPHDHKTDSDSTSPCNSLENEPVQRRYPYLYSFLPRHTVCPCRSCYMKSFEIAYNSHEKYFSNRDRQVHYSSAEKDNWHHAESRKMSPDVSPKQSHSPLIKKEPENTDNTLEKRDF